MNIQNPMNIMIIIVNSIIPFYANRILGHSICYQIMSSIQELNRNDINRLFR